MSENDRDVILVTVDSLRADHCGFLSDDRDLTPVLDGIATDGVVFERAIAPGPRTPSSMPEVFTGAVFGPRPRYDGWTLGDRKRRISTHLDRFPTIPERVSEVGYHTAGVTANPWTQYLPGTTFEKGFEAYTAIDGSHLFDGESGDTPGWLAPIDRALSVTGIGERYNWRWKKDWFIQWPHIFEAIQERYRTAPSPTFFWTFLLDTHEPYLAPKAVRSENGTLAMYRAVLEDKLDDGAGESLSEADRERLRRAYRDAVRSVDRFVERFLDACPDDAIVVFHSDHGEAFGEHGTWGHKPALYRENLHVPLVISGVDADRVAEPVSLRRLPAMLDALASDPDAFDPRDYTTDYAYATTEDSERRSLTGNEWKYIVGPDGPELYSLADDPAEETNLAGEHPELRDLLHRVERREQAGAIETATIARSAGAIEA